MVSTQLGIRVKNVAGLHGFMERLQTIYEAMNRAYDEIARHYGCSCEGCDGNCCKSYFHHHTVVEYLGLATGLQTLSEERRHAVRLLARGFVRERDRLQAAGEKIELMCPLSQEGLCGLYTVRPMICRLHGVPHSYRRPDMVLVTGEGCPKLVPPGKGAVVRRELDRTPFYTDMAALERQLRQEIEFGGRVKMTIADMIVAEAEELRE